MNFNRTTMPAKQEPKFRRPEILLHPNIPKPLHGCAPRVVKGQEWWDVVRKQTYAENNHCCFACGVHQSEAEVKQWLEAHEYYFINYKTGRLTLKELVALCHLCHNFIHTGRLQALVEIGELTKDFQKQVLSHGKRVLSDAGLKTRKFKEPKQCAEWADWRMIIDSKEYGPTSKSFEAWQRGDWKRWKP